MGNRCMVTMHEDPRGNTVLCPAIGSEETVVGITLTLQAVLARIEQVCGWHTTHAAG